VLETAFHTTVSYSPSTQHLPSPTPSLASDCASPEHCRDLLLSHIISLLSRNIIITALIGISQQQHFGMIRERGFQDLLSKRLSIVCSFRKRHLPLQRKSAGFYDHWFGNGTINSFHDFASAHMPYLWNAQRINVRRQQALEETSVVYHDATEVFWG